MGAQVRSSSGANGVDSTLIISSPAGAQAGDLLIAVLAVAGGAAVTITPPASWTLIRRTNGTGGSTDLALASYWIAPGSIAGTYSFLLDTARRAAAIMAAIMGANATPIDTSSGQTTDGSSVATSSANTSLDHALLLGAFACASKITFTPPASMTLIRDEFGQPAAQTPSLELDYKQQDAAGATGTFSASLSAADSGNPAQMIAIDQAAQDLSQWHPGTFEVPTQGWLRRLTASWIAIYSDATAKELLPLFTAPAPWIPAPAEGIVRARRARLGDASQILADPLLPATGPYSDLGQDPGPVRKPRRPALEYREDRYALPISKELDYGVEAPAPALPRSGSRRVLIEATVATSALYTPIGADFLLAWHVGPQMPQVRRARSWTECQPLDVQAGIYDQVLAIAVWPGHAVEIPRTPIRPVSEFATKVYPFLEDLQQIAGWQADSPANVRARPRPPAGWENWPPAVVIDVPAWLPVAAPERPIARAVRAHGRSDGSPAVEVELTYWQSWDVQPQMPGSRAFNPPRPRVEAEDQGLRYWQPADETLMLWHSLQVTPVRLPERLLPGAARADCREGIAEPNEATRAAWNVQPQAPRWPVRPDLRTLTEAFWVAPPIACGLIIVTGPFVVVAGQMYAAGAAAGDLVQE